MLFLTCCVVSIAHLVSLSMLTASVTTKFALVDTTSERTRYAHTHSLTHSSFINSFMFTVSPRSSSFVRQIQVNPFTGCVDVCYDNETRYEYDNVSRRAILNLMFNKNLSLGFWVNENLLPYYKNVSCVAA